MNRRLFFLFCTLFILTSFADSQDLKTYFEESGGKKTPRYDATIDFCRKLEAASPMVHYTSFGKSPQGRELPLLIVDKQGLSEPLQIRKNGKMILLVQACIHPGESEGKDAGFLLVRDIITGKIPKDLLDHVTLLFIPIFNVDGHERFGPWNRINQNGPEEMGWRVTANNLNLNRDFVKADAPEMQAWLRMYSMWMPDFFIDVHTTDGADYQYSLTYDMETSAAIDPAIADYSDTFLSEWTSVLKSRGVLNFPYVEFRNWYNPKSGLHGGVTPPMLSQGYVAFRNRPGLLLETHMLKPYDIRVDASYKAIVATMEIINRDPAKLKSAITKADISTSDRQFRKKPIPVKFDIVNTDSTMVDFLGFEYEEIKSDITGEIYFRYTDKKKTYSLPYFGREKITDSVMLPKAYIIPAEWITVIERMKCHGIRMDYLKKDTTMRVRAWKISNPRWQPNSYEGHHTMVNISAEDITIDKYFAAGSAVVATDQPAARLIAHMLEPDGMGSFVFWGFFDAVFEQKEYGERYVIEPMAAKMLKEDEVLRKEFEEKMKNDTAFAKNTFAILNWFYFKTPYGDKNLNVYPVGRID